MTVVSGGVRVSSPSGVAVFSVCTRVVPVKCKPKRTTERAAAHCFVTKSWYERGQSRERALQERGGGQFSSDGWAEKMTEILRRNIIKPHRGLWLMEGGRWSMVSMVRKSMQGKGEVTKGAQCRCRTCVRRLRVIAGSCWNFGLMKGRLCWLLKLSLSCMRACK